MKRFFYSLSMAAMVTISLSTGCQQWVHILLPGINGGGGECIEHHGLVHQKEGVSFCRLTTLMDRDLVDLGQHNCIADFCSKKDAALHAHCAGGKDHKKIYHGVSQGTATLVNWLGQLSHEEQENEAAAIILQSALEHGDAAILHTAKNYKDWLKWACAQVLPNSWILWFARLTKCPGYNAAGLQPINSAKNISPNIVKIILHNVDDPQLSIDGARCLYGEFVSKGDTNAYLFELKGPDKHLNPLAGAQDCERHMLALQAIFKKEGLPYLELPGIDEVDVAPWQPTLQEVSQRSGKTAH